VAPSLHASESPSEYSRRERKAIVLLTLAFIALSIVAHFIVGSLYGVIPPAHADAPPPESTMIITYETPTPKPTPPPAVPTPTSPPQDHPVTPPQPAASNIPLSTAPPVRPLRIRAGSSPGPGTDTPATASPGVVASHGSEVTPGPAPSFAPCRMSRKIQPDYPDWIKSAGIQGTAIVILSMGPNGDVLSERIGDSSGNAALDQAALAAARASSYECPPDVGRGGTDLYQVIYTFRLDS
jgi:protein TonB